MYLVDLPEGKKDIDDLTLAFSLGHTEEDSCTEILKHEGYTLVLKGTLILSNHKGETLSGSSAFEHIGHDTLSGNIDVIETDAGYSVAESPWFEWQDEQGYSINTINVISRNPEIEQIKLENLLDELFG